MKITLSAETVRGVAAKLEKANTELARHYPGEPTARQPIHTVYGGAHLWKRDAARKLGGLAVRVFEQYGADPTTFARALGLAPEHAELIHQRVGAKLRGEAVEDFRIDFEDGYGN